MSSGSQESQQSSSTPIRSRTRARFATVEWLESRRLMSTTGVVDAPALIGSTLGSLTLNAPDATQNLATMVMSPQGLGATDLTYLGQKYTSSAKQASPMYSSSQIGLSNLDGTNARIVSVANKVTSYDPRTRTAVIDAGFVKMTWQIINTDNKLTWTVTITNTSTDQVITGYNVFPTYLTFGSTPSYPEGHGINGMDGHIGIRINDGTRSMLIVNESHDKARYVTVQANDFSYVQYLRIGTMNYNGDTAGTQNINIKLQPGQSDSVTVSLRFIPQTMDTATAAPDQLSPIRDANPFRLNWSDRRPITNLFISGATGGNPLTSVPTSQAGWAAYKTNGLAWARTMAAAYTKANLQGMVVWDVEGPDQLKNNYAFAGDPRILPQTNPAFDSFADEWFKVFSDAGLRVGVTIRPGTLVKRSTGGYDRVADADPVQSIVDKVNYAKNRWGCSIFYVDCADAASITVLDQVNKRIPDVLLMPELTFGTQVNYQSFTIPYRDGGLYLKTPASVKALYPGSASLIAVTAMPKYGTAAEAAAARAQLVDAVRQGDILLLGSWQLDYGASIVKDANVPMFRTTTTGTSTGSLNATDTYASSVAPTKPPVSGGTASSTTGGSTGSVSSLPAGTSTGTSATTGTTTSTTTGQNTSSTASLFSKTGALSLISQIFKRAA